MFYLSINFYSTLCCLQTYKKKDKMSLKMIYEVKCVNTLWKQEKIYVIDYHQSLFVLKYLKKYKLPII